MSTVDDGRNLRKEKIQMDKRLDSGLNVMIARKRKKLTQNQVCEAAGISRPYLSKIENGKDATVSKEIMLKLASVLDSTVEYLFFSEED